MRLTIVLAWSENKSGECNVLLHATVVVFYGLG